MFTGLVNILPVCLAINENMTVEKREDPSIAPAPEPATPDFAPGVKDPIAPRNPEICALLAMNVLMSGTPPENAFSRTCVNCKYSVAVGIRATTLDFLVPLLSILTVSAFAPASIRSEDPVRAHLGSLLPGL